MLSGVQYLDGWGKGREGSGFSRVWGKAEGMQSPVLAPPLMPSVYFHALHSARPGKNAIS